MDDDSSKLEESIIEEKEGLVVSYSMDREDVIIPERLATGYHVSYSRQAVVRFMGYGDHEYQSPIERRNILERAFRANFPTDQISDTNLILHIEDYGPPESEQRFRRICRYLHGRGRSIIEANVDKRVDENHRSFRQVHQTFEDGMWFVKTFGRKFGYIGYGRLISEVPEGVLPRMSNPVDLAPEPLLIFCIEELPTSHSIFLPSNYLENPDSELKFCKGARSSAQIQFKEEEERDRKFVLFYGTDEYEKEHNTMIEDENGNVRCSSCGMDYYSDTAEISEQKYRNHAHLIRRRFEIRDFVSDDDFDREWTRQRGTLDPEAEAAIARVFLNDHIAPMRADTEEMAGIPGDSIKRYGLDRPQLSPDPEKNVISEKWRWPQEVMSYLSTILIRIERTEWENSSDDQRISLLKSKGAHTMKRIKDDLKVGLHAKLEFRTEKEFQDLFKHVRKEMQSEDSSFAVAGHGGGVRYAMFLKS